MPFESLKARTLNEEVFKKIKDDALEQTRRLAKQKVSVQT